MLALRQIEIIVPHVRKKTGLKAGFSTQVGAEYQRKPAM
jgi:hypothetical protein